MFMRVLRGSGTRIIEFTLPVTQVGISAFSVVQLLLSQCNLPDPPSQRHPVGCAFHRRDSKSAPLSTCLFLCARILEYPYRKFGTHRYILDECSVMRNCEFWDSHIDKNVTRCRAMHTFKIYRQLCYFLPRQISLTTPARLRRL